MQANPDETCLSAALKLNIHRKRIAKLLQLIDVLPADLIEHAKECTDPKVLRKMSIRQLLEITNDSPNYQHLWQTL